MTAVYGIDCGGISKVEAQTAVYKLEDNLGKR